MTARPVTVFGGTGFLGRRIVDALVARGAAVRVATRHPDRVAQVFGEGAAGLESVAADVHDGPSCAAAVDGAAAVINAVSLYAETRAATFRSVHVEGAARLAKRAREAGSDRFVLASGIGANARSPSAYVRSRGQGEHAVRHAFPTATILRPAVLFGPGDAFLGPLAGMLRWMPVFALFGRGRMKLQPVHVDDVAQAAAKLALDGSPQPVWELGGPRIYSYRALLRTLLRYMGRRRLLVPVPFVAWHVAARLAELLPRPPLTRNQVALMRIDTVASPDLPGLEALGIVPASIEEALPAILGPSRA